MNDTDLDYSRLLNLLWRTGGADGRTFEGVAGEKIIVVATGEQGSERGVWIAAEVMIDGERRRGPVAVGESVPVPDGAVLRVVTGDVPPVLGLDDRLVPQILYPLDARARERYDALRAGAAACGCAQRVAAMDPLERLSLLTGLVVERLKRKTERIEALLDKCGGDWNQTLHVMLLAAMGGDRNRDAFTAIAQRATALVVSREKSSLPRVEALLLGTAGFLASENGAAADFWNTDDYTLILGEEFRHLAAKYSITPLRPAEWNLTKIYPANHPAVRLAEIAALLCGCDFLLDGFLNCRNSCDIEHLMSATASEYWNTHYTPSGEASAPARKSIGRAKARLVGINLAVPLLFAYGRRTGDEDLCERALDVLATIPAERNARLRGWYDGGCPATGAFDSQALLELGGEYCAAEGCAECPVGRRIVVND